MIKYLKYLFMAAITMVAATGCQEEMEDAFSTAPVAPTLTSNGSILLTQNTMTESVKWAWTAARYTTGTVEYALYAQYEETTPVQIGTTTDLTLSMPKADFHTLLEGIAEAPENDTFDLDFYVTATDDVDTYTSERLMIRVYSYGDAVPAEATPAAEAITLSEDEPDAEVALLSWTPARLGYNEAITYAITASYNGQSTTVASELTETSYSTTVQALNELLVKALALPAGTPVEVAFTVYAFSETVTEGVPSAAATIAVTAYELPYPKEEYIYIPGNHQGWAPATAPRLRSVNLDGVYTGFCYLDGEFKFTLQPAWGEGGAGEYNASHFPNKGSNLGGEGTGNLSIDQPGFYYLEADVMTGTLTATLVESWGAIGTAVPTGWDAEVPFTWDATKGCWSATTTLTAGGAVKFRVNNSWDITDLGGALDDLVIKGSDITVPADVNGKYLIELYLQRTDSEQMYATLTAQ